MERRLKQQSVEIGWCVEVSDGEQVWMR